jgi:hypothetical protein
MAIRPALPALALSLCAAPLAAGDIAAERAHGTLRGTLERPANEVRAAALILPGSGPTDRDGNNAQGLRTDAYRLLAVELAARGIATARIDKRGIGESAGGADLEISLGAYRGDTEAWIAVLRAETGAACIWLIGHSEGGYLALDAAGLDGVCGIVLLTAPGEPLGALMRDQIAAQPALAPLLSHYDAAMDLLLSGGTPAMADLPVALRPIFSPENLVYLRELALFRPAEVLAALELPVLILHGGADIQVPAAQGDALAAARPGVVREVLDGMTHTLKRVGDGDGDGALRANLATYSDPSLPLHGDLVPAIAGFILGTDG